MLYIPAGFAHGFTVLSDNVDFLYKCTAEYSPESDCGIIWNDPDLGVKWPLEREDAVISNKDLSLKSLSQLLEDNVL
jgi:dTDP-4-dehydrorhamnose 3,5-epimerase